MWTGFREDRAGMSTSRAVKKNFPRLVLVAGVIYFVYMVGLLRTAEDREDPVHVVKKDLEIYDVKDGKRSEQRKSDPLEKTLDYDRDESLYQEIDVDEAHREKRLQVLEEIYKVDRVSDDTYKLNESLSRISDLDRPSADLRPKFCLEKKYDLDKLPTVSVIFPIYNEALSLILRAVHSVINNTPEKLLADVILVDDNSQYANLKEPLDRYLKMLPSKVKVLRNPKREGLIRARMRGAEIATGDVFLFQDAHTEFGPSWAQPALEYIQKHPNTIVQPQVQELNPKTLKWPSESKPSDELWRGVFMWDMRFAWNKAPVRYNVWKVQEHDPYPNPVLVGCSLLVDKKFFYKIGGFDSGLEVWGGENLELSFRTWMCGGKMVIHPCSEIAHVFKEFSYSFDGDKEHIVAKNSIRVVETWMDEYRPFYYASNFVYPFKRTELDHEKLIGLREHKQLREKLGCKSFGWYLRNVLPEMSIPSKDHEMFGEIQNIASSLCWKIEDDGWITSTIDCYTYSRMKPEDEFGLSKDGRLMHGDRCISVHLTHLLRAVPCNEEGYQSVGWSFVVSGSPTLGVLKFRYQGIDGDMCFQQVTNINDIHKNEQMPQLIPCKNGEPWQVWAFSYRLDFSYVPNPPV